MTYLVIANVEELDGARFTVINVYNETELVDTTIKPFEDYRQSADMLIDEMYVLNQTLFEVWTTDTQLYSHLVAMPGVAATVKHRSETEDTARSLEQVADIMRDIYELVPPPELPKLPTWRSWLYRKLLKITNLIGGQGKYETI